MSKLIAHMNLDQSNVMAVGAGRAVESASDDSPFDSEFFFVQGVNFKCMAYRDDLGKWRGAFNHLELPGMIHVLG